MPNSARLDNAQLLFEEMLNDWRSWFAKADSKRSEFTRSGNISDNGQMMQAAILGLMVSLASERVAHRHLPEGRLVKPVRIQLGRASILCASERSRKIDRPLVKVLWD
ncbi:MAG: hypothetical protein A3D16_20205 [Rhodobacterales bacterium RIFCSPHIGHO2_02_FULL_62_130]|nr:MAG: hypothetical protein A3D16_20205 [Rhodobacterales bacterium RIFCSPHIGHO2_02_FULL_62_130]OHC56890.1 MAG: hypothetical protein A3E48_17645 [Rhodobacterales bacterium RIFCSPHIGHO2_12_FULL_62_75]